MSETRSSRDPDPTDDAASQPEACYAPPGEETPSVIQPLRLPGLDLGERNPWLIVEVDGSPAGHGALCWALHEAARRDATVVAVHVFDAPDDDPLGSGRTQPSTQLAAQNRLEAHVLRALAETGVQGRSRSAVLPRPVFEALSAAAQGADLMVVGPGRRSLLRHADPCSPTHRPARGA